MEAVPANDKHHPVLSSLLYQFHPIITQDIPLVGNARSLLAFSQVRKMQRTDRRIGRPVGLQR